MAEALPAASAVIRSAEAVARRLANGALPPDTEVRPVLVNGSAGAVVIVRGKPFAVMSFTVTDGKITEITTIADAQRVGRIAAAVEGIPEFP